MVNFRIMDWKSVLSKLAPTAAYMLGGPLAQAGVEATKTAAMCWPTTATDTGRLFDGA